MRKFLKDFSRTEIRDIAINYSQNPVVNLWAETYGISTYMLKKLLYKAIYDCIVENNVAIAILDSIKNRAMQHSKNGKSSALYYFNIKYEKVVAERKEFMLSDEDAVWLTRDYAASPLKKEDFCFENAVSRGLLSKSLLHVTCNCLVEYTVVDVLEEKALAADGCNPVIVEELFEKIARARRRYEQNHSKKPQKA